METVNIVFLTICGIFIFGYICFWVMRYFDKREKRSETKIDNSQKESFKVFTAEEIMEIVNNPILVKQRQDFLEQIFEKKFETIISAIVANAKYGCTKINISSLFDGDGVIPEYIKQKLIILGYRVSNNGDISWDKNETDLKV